MVARGAKPRRWKVNHANSSKEKSWPVSTGHSNEIQNEFVQAPHPRMILISDIDTWMIAAITPFERTFNKHPFHAGGNVEDIYWRSTVWCG